jgi:phage-related holin
MEAYLAQFIALANGTKLSVLVALIFANLVTGVAVSIYTRTFRLKEIGDFLLTRVLPYVLSYFAVVTVAVVEPVWEKAVTVVWGIIILALAGAILQNLKEMGIQIPDFLGGKPDESQ